MSRRKNTESAFALHQEAYALSDAGDVPGAIATLTDLVAKHPNHAAGWCSLARMRIVTRDFPGALGAARRAISCDPEKAVGHINAGIALRELGHLEESRRHLEEAIRKDATASVAHYQLARTLQRLGEHRDATTGYALAIAHVTRAMDHGQPMDEIITQSIESAAALPEIPDSTPFLSAFIAAVQALSHKRRASAYAAVTRLTDVASTVEERDIVARLTERYWHPKK